MPFVIEIVRLTLKSLLSHRANEIFKSFEQHTIIKISYKC